jgi:hypothetical protein
MQEKIYETVDIGLAAWLRSEGITLLRIERRGHSVWLIFNDTGYVASNAADAYYYSPRGRHAYQLIAKYKDTRNRVLDTRDGRVTA